MENFWLKNIFSMRRALFIFNRVIHFFFAILSENCDGCSVKVRMPEHLSIIWFSLDFDSTSDIYSVVSDINKLIFIYRKFLADVFSFISTSYTYSSHSAAVSVFFSLLLGCQYILRLSKCANIRESSCWIFLLIKFHFFFFCCFAFNTIFDPFLPPSCFTSLYASLEKQIDMKWISSFFWTSTSLQFSVIECSSENQKKAN